MRRLFFGILIASAIFYGSPASGQRTDSGYVLQVNGRLLFLDKGEQDQVRPGDLFKLVRQEEILHPETGENLAGEVDLGAMRVVEVFPRLSTAEVVHLVRGMTLETVDREARQGIIHFKSLPPEEEMAVRQRLQARSPGLMPFRANPDGRVRKLAPEIRFSYGNRPRTGLPEHVFQLLPAEAVSGDYWTGLLLPDSAYADIAGVGLLALADTLGSEPVNLGAAMLAQIGMTYPVSERLTAMAQFRLGSQSTFLAGGRVFPGRLLGFLGDGRTPEGRVGEPVLTLMLGRGGEGSQSLSEAARAQLVALDLVAGPEYISALEEANLAVYVDAAVEDKPAVADSLLQADVTAVLQQFAADSLQAMHLRGWGTHLALSLPVARRITVNGHLTHLGNIQEVGGGLTYYWRPLIEGQTDANPVGMLRAPVLTAGGRYHWKAKTGVFDLGLSLPVSVRFSVSGAVQTNFGGFTRLALTLNRY